MLELLEKENATICNLIAKPDLKTHTGREFLSFYLQGKLKQLLTRDSQCKTPIVSTIKPDLISKFAKRLVSDYDKRILIGVTGESASGKTTICKKLKEVIELFNMPVEILSADNYFNDISSLVQQHNGFDELMKTGFDVDSPNNFQLDLLKSDLTKLANGSDIFAPQYLVNGTGISLANKIPVKSKKIIVVEGIATMYGSVGDIFDIKIYVDVNKDKQKELFLGRAKERNQTHEDCLKHWHYVNHVSEKYIRPSKEKADIIINGYSDLNYYCLIFLYLYKITNNFVTA